MVNMVTPETSRLFEAWTDPQSGVTSYLLNERVAPLQLSFYFTNPSFSTDGRTYWFYCAHPPAGAAQNGRTLGCIDFESDSLHWFPETQFFDASPGVDPASGTVYWCTRDAVWRRSPDPAATAEHVNDFPEDLSLGRLTHRLATHLTFNATGTELCIDAQIGNDFFVGAMPIDGGKFELWQQFKRCYNHGQFSPTDPDLMLIAQDYWLHPLTGERFGYDNRMWLIRRGEQATPIFPESPHVGHEWWAADGQSVWYVEYARGTARVDVAGGEATMVWPGGRWHSHSDKTDRYLVGDNHLRDEHRQPTGAKVSFYNIETGREVDLVSVMPIPDPYYGWYHVHPHPQFSLDDRYIVYTTTVRGTVDVAMTPVADLIAATI